MLLAIVGLGAGCSAQNSRTPMINGGAHRDEPRVDDEDAAERIVNLLEYNGVERAPIDQDLDELVSGQLTCGGVYPWCGLVLPDGSRADIFGDDANDLLDIAYDLGLPIGTIEGPFGQEEDGYTFASVDCQQGVVYDDEGEDGFTTACWFAPGDPGVPGDPGDPGNPGDPVPAFVAR
jgi:hypothetical protein